jgi:hypothetical protein
MLDSPCRCVSMQTERRHGTRIKPLGLIHLKLASANAGIILDLCEGGFRFRSVAPFELGRTIHFQLSLAPTNRLQAAGEIVWTDPSRKIGGLQFTTLPESAREQLRSWLDLHNLQQLDMEDYAGAVANDTEVGEFPAEPANHSTASDSIAGRARLFTCGAETAREAEPSASVDEQVQAIGSSVMHADPDAATSGGTPESRTASLLSYDGAAAVPFLRNVIRSSRDSFASAIASEDVHFAPDRFLIPVVNFAVTSSNACVGFLRSVATPGAFREAVKFATVIGTVVLLLALGLNVQGDLGNSLIHIGRRIAGEHEAAPRESAPSAYTRPKAAQPDPVPAAPSRFERSSRASARNSDAPPALLVPGQAELETARQYLEGTDGAPEPRKAAAWLWASVHKGNLAADILLADLYIRGDGVAQNCQQGIVLLTAAVKKGDAAAIQKMNELDSGPCAAAAQPQ